MKELANAGGGMLHAILNAALQLEVSVACDAFLASALRHRRRCRRNAPHTVTQRLAAASAYLSSCEEKSADAVLLRAPRFQAARLLAAGPTATRP
eukprot:1209275-Rhodomonas_salina.1